MALVLHDYWRSGTSYRTRIALNLKGLDYDRHAVNLIAGDQSSAAFRTLNPQALVPALEIGGEVLTQSPALLEWLEETYPEPPLLPAEPLARARVRAMAALIGCDIHPLNNMRVLKAVRGLAPDDPAAPNLWALRWIADGFTALELLVARHGAGFAFGDRPSLVDCYLVPQVYSARRFGADLSAFPRIVAVDARAAAHPAFAAAHPDRQPDAPAD